MKETRTERLQREIFWHCSNHNHDGTKADGDLPYMYSDLHSKTEIDLTYIGSEGHGLTDFEVWNLEEPGFARLVTFSCWGDTKELGIYSKFGIWDETQLTDGTNLRFPIADFIRFYRIKVKLWDWITARYWKATEPAREWENKWYDAHPYPNTDAESKQMKVEWAESDAKRDEWYQDFVPMFRC